ncbi:MAG TPA: NUDIX hydrolase [Bacillales bacterium]|nr:NUDIX hydrolase [Bacillales bacterium]
MKRVDVAYAFIYDEGKNAVLLVKNLRGDSYDFTLPGGAAEEGETLAEAAVREAKEETGYDIEVNGIAVIAEGLFTKKQHHTVFHTFYATISGGEMKVTRPEEIADVFWAELKRADELLEPIELKPSEVVKSQPYAPYIFRGTF